MQSPKFCYPSTTSSSDRIRRVSSQSAISQPSMFSMSSTRSSKRDSCEVPVVLQRESARILYEDIAKLNPFYKEYQNFWNTEPEESSLTFSSTGSTRSDSLASLPSSRDSFRPLEVSSSPPLRHFRSHFGLNESSKLHVLLHDGNEYQPTFSEYDGQNTSQFAALDYAESVKRPLTPIAEPPEDCDLDGLDPELNRPVHPSKYPHKKLFGDNGWLGCPTDVHELPSEKRKSTILKGFSKRIKKQVGDIADDVAKVGYPNRFSQGSLRRSKSFTSSTARVSLDPAAQAKLYSEMEVMICLSANDFLIQQHSENRLSSDSLKKTNSFWGSKNRPQVVQFHFDQATQRRLILSNLRSLQFNGECSTNPILLSANLHNWKSIVKEMSVRTFCAPDSVIRKHLHDIHKILDMLGAPPSTFLAFEELQMRTWSLMSTHLREKYRSGSDGSTFSGSRGSRASSIRYSEDSPRMCQTKC